MKKRGAYFFVLDALLGGTIFLISVVIILGSYLNAPQTRQSFTLSEDLMSLLLNTKVIELRDPYIIYLAEQGLITNTEQSLFEQITELHYTGKNEEAHNLTRNIIESLLPEQFGVQYVITHSIDNTETIIYNRSMENLNFARFHLSSKKITFFTPDQETIIGPDITELRIWS